MGQVGVLKLRRRKVWAWPATSGAAVVKATLSTLPSDETTTFVRSRLASETGPSDWSTPALASPLASPAGSVMTVAAVAVAHHIIVAAITAAPPARSMLDIPPTGAGGR